MRPELTDLLSVTERVVVVTGDAGTGKSSLLLDHQHELSRGPSVAPPPVTCLYDSGALQVAVIDGLVSAMTIAAGDESIFRRIQRRLEVAGKEMAVEIGKSLVKAVLQEVMAQVKARLGEHAGEGLKAFVKGLRNDAVGERRRELQSRSDANVVKVLVRMCDEVAVAVQRDLVIALDECQRLTDDDQRALATIVVKPPEHARLILAWSSAEYTAIEGLRRLRGAGCTELAIGGLSRDEVERWLIRDGVSAQHADRVHFLSDGFPLIVEGLISQLRSGGSLDAYTPPTAFVQSLDDALARLSHEENVATRRLAAFDDPPAPDNLSDYLGGDATHWGALSSALQRENILSVDRNGRQWFHESRRAHLWNQILSPEERVEIGQPAYETLLAQYRDDTESSFGLLVPIARLARFATTNQAANPQLTSVLELSDPELAVLAAITELEITHPDGTRWAPPEAAVIYAHTTFGADRGAALAALPRLVEKEFISEPLPELSSAPEVVSSVDDDPQDEARIVLHGRIQVQLGKSVVPQITGRIVHEHFETMRLESTLVVSTTGRSDLVDLIGLAGEHRLHRYNPFGGKPYPVMAVWIEYGERTISMVGIFNTPHDLALARKAAVDVNDVSYGRRITAEHTFSEPAQRIPSMRLLRVVYFATGRAVTVAPDGEMSNWELINPGPPLPIHEYAQRQIDLIEILRTNCDNTEKDVYALTEPRGMAVGRDTDTYYFVELRGTTQVLDMTPENTEIIRDRRPFTFALLEHNLALGPDERTKKINERGQPAGLIDDPVVRQLEELWGAAAEFNKHQPTLKIKLQRGSLPKLLRAAHIRDMALARLLSERLSVGGSRGHRPQSALRVAIYLPPSTINPSIVVFAMPQGDPEDVLVKFCTEPSPPVDAAALYRAAFATEPDSELMGGEAQPTIANLLGFHSDDIVVTR